MDSITFKKNGVTKNTNTDWGLVPTGQIDPPSLFEKERTGVIRFMMRFGDVPASMRLDSMTEMLCGEEDPVAIFSTDPAHEYRGKWFFKKITAIGVGLKIEMSYTLDEFKFEKNDVNSKWEWNEFDFENGVDRTDVFSNLEATNDKKYISVGGMSKEELKGHIGDAPVCPEFINKSDSLMRFKAGGKIVEVAPGETKKDEAVVIDPAEDIELSVKGKGLYAISFTRGVR